MGGTPIERFETVVIGGGQAGLTTGYYLARRGRRFVILDANERIGDTWRRRWDSLRLFTPARYDRLPGLRFPAAAGYMPTKDEVADYLEDYARHFSLPVRSGVRVERLARAGDRFEIATADGRLEADEVVIATGAYGTQRVPAIARELDPSILQLHAAEYRNPSQLRDGGVLVVGTGNSGAEISLDVVGSHPTWLSGRDRPQVPFHVDTFVARHLLVRLVKFIGMHMLTRRTPIGRRLSAKLEAQGIPLVRVKRADLAAAGVIRVPRTVGVVDGRPLLDDGQVLDVANVIWCTGYRQDLSWVDLPIFGDDGRPTHERGIVTSEPGLSFVGLAFQFAEASDVLPGVSRDARYVVRRLGRRSRDRIPAEAGLEAA